MRNICELLKIKYPIIQGGMANITDASLAAAVSNAGGLGVIACGGGNPEWVRAEIRKCRSLTKRPFGINIMLMSPYAPEIANLVLEERVPVVITGAGNPGPYIPAWKQAGIIVLPVIPTVALARRVERSGADGVIAEGTEAGGHIGELTTMALVPQAVDSLSIPVIAAGGIADKRGVLAAFALGAKGVQVGTVILTSSECAVHPNYKKKILDAKDTDTVVTGRSTKAPVRVLKNLMAKEYLELTKKNTSLEELEQMTMGSLKRAVIDGDLDRGSFMAGQISGLIKEIKPLKEIFEEMFLDINQYKDSLKII